MAWLEYLLPLIFLTPLGATAVVVLALRNLHDARVRSPFDAHPLREPGQALRDRLDRAFSSLFLNGALGPIVVLTPLVYGMGRMLFAPHQNWVEWAIYGLLSTLLVLLFCFLLMLDYQRIRRIKLGLACELAVGQELERLIRPESHPYFVFHDVPSDTFTIDHVVVTPHGLFVVETRARTHPLDATGAPRRTVVVERERLRFPGWSERLPLRKTRQATTWLRQWLNRHHSVEAPVRGVLVLPDWDIEQEHPFDDPLVVDGEGLAQLLIDTSLGDLDRATHDKITRALTARAASQDARRLQRPSV
ncbi:Nuclease-related domain-containing protein [Modicisalibacter ilicicola DSM 19980]|uniref:Nuclease-related domain-containing protein n=1 Tax=Modicisalibacter ilicicola DSM 19980 TaxID=1121942 RepID=A0A1M5B1R5_9GAMM|nr:nuclease-related domain-containing protein [Halomonas ilicicola]SHF36132.1 Nuclease-related domain-containing protein [Halomonas ilicicola DSM 19980]